MHYLRLCSKPRKGCFTAFSCYAVAGSLSLLKLRVQVKSINKYLVSCINLMIICVYA